MSRDEELLRKVAREGKITIDGQDFPIKPTKPNYAPKVNPTTFSSEPELHLPASKQRASWQDDERPEVALREGIRAAIRGGLSSEKIKEIFEHELIFGVMES